MNRIALAVIATAAVTSTVWAVPMVPKVTGMATITPGATRITEPLKGAFDTGLDVERGASAPVFAPNGLTIDMTKDPHPAAPAVSAVIKVGLGKRCLIMWQNQCIVSGTHMEVK